MYTRGIYADFVDRFAMRDAELDVTVTPCRSSLPPPEMQVRRYGDGRSQISHELIIMGQYKI